MFWHVLIICFSQGTANVSEKASGVKFPQPVIIIRGSFKDPKDCFIATESKVLSQVPLLEIPYILICAFYALNMQYTDSCTNFYSFFEHLFLNISPPKRSKLNHFITSFTNI